MPSIDCRLSYLLVAFPRAATVDYFPQGKLDETSQGSKTREQWYSEHLRALKEPSLWELSRTSKAQSYRFLWLRTFHHPISLRLEIQSDGAGLLITKMASGQGGYDPGKLILNRTRSLKKVEVSWFLERVEESGFWRLPEYQKPAENVGPSGEKTIEVGLDGAQWVLEGAEEGRYHVTDRWSPKDGPVRNLGLAMLLDLAKLKLLFEEVY